MIWRIIGLVLAAALLIGYRLPLQPRTQTLSPARDSWSLSSLFLASILTLFAELAVIRWVATEVRVFAYVKNLALLLCFLGFGLGCALARQNPRWLTAVKALLGLFVVVRLPWYSEGVMERLSQTLGAGRDLELWSAKATSDWPAFLVASVITAVLLLLITYIFIPMGQTVSRQIELAPRPLYGYSWNLAGSLVGIAIFFAASWMALPPSVWFVAVLACIAILQSTRRERILLAAAAVPVGLLLVDPSTPHYFKLWTPYQMLEVVDQALPSGEFVRTQIRVNHHGYQDIVNLSPEFLDRHPNLLTEPRDENPYNLPFRFTPPQPKVLIVGSGTGDDVAGALRGGSRAVDAVEIDPKILALGRQHLDTPIEARPVPPLLTMAGPF